MNANPADSVERLSHERGLYLDLARSLITAIEGRDPYSRGHSLRVAELAAGMARALGLPNEQVDTYWLAGLVHDVGKIAVPEGVLCKESSLSPAEILAVQKHPEVGFDMLKGAASLQEVLPGVLHHHERFDGFGYPHGLAGERIPLTARVLAICDTFDAMSSDRSYRLALPPRCIREEIARCAGTQFDPKLVEVFLRLIARPAALAA